MFDDQSSIRKTIPDGHRQPVVIGGDARVNHPCKWFSQRVIASSAGLTDGMATFVPFSSFFAPQFSDPTHIANHDFSAVTVDDFCGIRFQSAVPSGKALLHPCMSS
jgi:hypothetical protein